MDLRPERCDAPEESAEWLNNAAKTALFVKTMDSLYFSVFVIIR